MSDVQTVDASDLAAQFDSAKSITDWLDLREQVGEFDNGPQQVRDLIDRFPDSKADNLFHRAMALWLAGKHREAADCAGKAKDNSGIGDWVRGQCLRELDQLDEAEAAYEKAKGKQELHGILGVAELRVMQNRVPEAHDLLKGLGADAEKVADFWYLRGLVSDYNGHTDEAIRFYERAVDIDELHHGARFRLAYYADLVGDDSQAMFHYESLRDSTPVHVNTLINLGINYEDRENYPKAAECYRLVLQRFPNHPRARLFLKDAEASMTMYYDEDQERREDKLQQLLGTPVTEFELSVRSRNCLARMKIETLGDLIKKTEQELLSYKNFGETSLQEIKSILAKKGLRLGMQPGDEAAVLLAEPDETAQDEVLNKPIADLNFSVRVRKVMEKLEIKTLGDLTRRKESELTSLKNFGKTSLAELKKKLAEYGLSLAPE